MSTSEQSKAIVSASEQSKVIVSTSEQSKAIVSTSEQSKAIVSTSERSVDAFDFVSQAHDTEEDMDLQHMVSALSFYRALQLRRY